jgi:hypothetical protein
MTVDLRKKPLVCRWQRSADGPIKCTWKHAPGTPARPSYLSDIPLGHNSGAARQPANGTRAFVGIAWVTHVLPSLVLGLFLLGLFLRG